MPRYFAIVENVHEVHEIGEYTSLIEASNDAETIEHVTHNEGYILVAREHLPKLIDRIQRALEHG